MSDNSDSEQRGGIFNEDPGTNLRHPVNLLRRMGMQMMRYRRRFNGEGKSASAFGLELARYTGKQVDRNRLARAESGDIAVRFDVYASYFAEMGIMEDIVESMMRANSKDIRMLINHDADIPGRLKSLVMVPDAKDEGDENE